MGDFMAMKNLGKFYKAGQGYILPLLPKYDSEDIWPTDPKLAIAKEMFKLALPAGYALKNQNKLASLMQSKLIVGKMFAQATILNDSRKALDGALKDIADLKLLA